MPRSPNDWKSADRRVLWHPFTQMRDWAREDPLIVERAEGFHLIDVDGRRYIDGHSSLWVNIHGHGHPAIVQAIADQARQLDHSTLLGLGNTPSIALAERLLAMAPPGLTRVFYSDAGATAMEIALKIAFQYWRLAGEPARDKFVTFRGAYHGDTVGSVSIGAIDAFHETFRPLLFDTLKSPWPRPYRDARHRDDPAACLDASLNELADLLARNDGRVAAVVTEAYVQAADGIHVAPRGWMTGVERLCREHGALFVVDEVATGFCRTGKLFACELEGTRPDLLAVAKGLSGGALPLAATLASERVYAAFLGEYGEFRHFFHGHTYTGNPIACAAALANLDLIDSSGLLRRLPETVRVFADLLEPLRAHPHVGEIRQLGLMAGLELVRDRRDRSPWDAGDKVPQRIAAAARRGGAVIRPLGNVMVLMPPPAMPDALLGELVGITSAAIDAVLARES